MSEKETGQYVGCMCPEMELRKELEQAQARIRELEKQVQNMALEGISAEGQWIEHTTALALRVKRLEGFLLQFHKRGDALLDQLVCEALAASSSSTQPAAEIIKAHDAKVIERCAEVCERHAMAHEKASESSPVEEWREISVNQSLGAEACAAAIRALAAVPEHGDKVEKEDV